MWTYLLVTIRVRSIMKNNKYQCCFCNETITSNNIDVTSLIVVFNWDKSEQLQQEQQLFCHVNCLK